MCACVCVFAFHVAGGCDKMENVTAEPIERISNRFHVTIVYNISMHSVLIKIAIVHCVLQ